jgi:hypothetical protein
MDGVALTRDNYENLRKATRAAWKELACAQPMQEYML